MGDEDQRHVSVFHEVLEQRRDLCLDDRVERARRLVGNQHGWSRRNRRSDGDPLPLTAGKLVRVGANRILRLGDAYTGQKFDRLLAGCLAAEAKVTASPLTDLVTDRQHGIEA